MDLSHRLAQLRGNGRDRPWMPFTVLVIGVLTIVILFGTNQIRNRSIEQDTTRVLAIGEIQLLVATSHLWLEEYVTGDEVDLESITQSLDRSLALVDGLLGAAPGAKPSTALLALQPLADPAMRRHASNMKYYLERFREISDWRRQGFSTGESVGIGSTIDVEYDRVFADLLTEAKELEDSLARERSASLGRWHTIFSATMFIWSAIVILAAAGLWTRERRRRQAEKALQASQDQLLQAQKMEAVGRLADGLAHDINNYLAAIRGHCELIRMKRPEGDRISRKMDSVIRTVARASTLIERLLAFSRRQPSEPRVVNLNRVIAGLEGMLRRLLSADIELELHLAEDLHNTRIDPAQIEQLVLNLLVNARDAIRSGGRIVLATSNDEGLSPTSGDHRSYVRLTASDTGQGIPPEIRDKIFDPFFTTKEGSGNSGLGLATVYGIVTQHDGTIEVDSRPSEGTVFTLRLPAVDASEPPEPVPRPESDTDLSGDESILLVDDHESFRESTRALLESLGYRVVTAVDGEEGLAAFTQPENDFQLVLSDVVMPGLSGRELMERLRENSDVKMIFMSGYADDVLDRYHLDPSRTDFLKKPFSINDLARLIRQLLDR